MYSRYIIVSLASVCLSQSSPGRSDGGGPAAPTRRKGQGAESRVMRPYTVFFTIQPLGVGTWLLVGAFGILLCAAFFVACYVRRYGRQRSVLCSQPTSNEHGTCACTSFWCPSNGCASSSRKRIKRESKRAQGAESVLSFRLEQQRTLEQRAVRVFTTHHPPTCTGWWLMVAAAGGLLSR